MKGLDTSEVDDGAWIFVYFVIDLAVLALDAAFMIFMVCVEIACWALAGGFDFLLSLMGFDDD
jgi:hypothetical protein